MNLTLHNDVTLCSDKGIQQVESSAGQSIILRPPVVSDGYAITSLIQNSPPLDVNSAYCNLIQCTHFADSCIVAECQKKIVGWISAYRPPADLSRVFIWQVAVHPEARGQGLAKKMLNSLLSRESIKDANYLITTITKDNQQSWALFESFARARNLPMAKTPYFEKDAHFSGAHETEWLVEIGPFESLANLKN
jgi:L-2,4-diaminobutyric acid acetyltransferase